MNIYILEDKFGSMYIGITNNLDRRLNEHKTGQVATTRKLNFRSLKLRHFWVAPSYSLASRFERYLHSIPKAEVLDLLLDCKYWCDMLQELAETKVLLNEEKAKDMQLVSNPLHSIVSLPNKDQLARI